MDRLVTRSADGTVIGCEVVGDGPPLLAIHGSVADRNRWAAVRDALAASYRLHLMDRRGRGLSAEEAPGDYAIAREGEDVAAVVAAIGEPTLVLAHSYGASCVLQGAASAPGIARMLLYEPAFATGPASVFPESALAAVRAARERGDREAIVEIFLRDVLALDAATVSAVRASPMWAVRLAGADALEREGRAANAFVPARFDGAGVRILVGTDTTPALYAAALAAHEALPGSDLRELPGHGHAAMDADPAMFVAQVRDWLVQGSTTAVS